MDAMHVMMFLALLVIVVRGTRLDEDRRHRRQR
jgi:hypothetical protein